jgi:serine/threonine protein kinase
MAEVWRAKRLAEPSVGMWVALKRILPELRSERSVLEMFLSEARLALVLRHPNIVHTFEVGEVHGQPYIAMELLDGMSLHALLRACKQPVPVGFSAYVVHEICRALAFAHALTDEAGTLLRIVHRDIDPSNVVLRRDGSVKLIDFGVAKALGLNLLDGTRRGLVKGKIGYMAPEVIRGSPYDHRADLFVVGVVLHELLAGRRLFKGSNEYATVKLNSASRVMPPSTVNPDVPAPLDEITMNAVSRDPRTRYASAEELANDLAQFLETHAWTSHETAELVTSCLERKRLELERAIRDSRGGPPLTAANRHKRATESRSAAHTPDDMATVRGNSLELAATVSGAPTPVPASVATGSHLATAVFGGVARRDPARSE